MPPSLLSYLILSIHLSLGLPRFPVACTSTPMILLPKLFRRRSNITKNAATEISRYSVAFTIVVYFRIRRDLRRLYIASKWYEIRNKNDRNFAAFYCDCCCYIQSNCGTIFTSVTITHMMYLHERYTVSRNRRIGYSYSLITYRYAGFSHALVRRRIMKPVAVAYHFRNADGQIKASGIARRITLIPPSCR